MAIDDDIAFFERVPTLGLLGRGALRILAIGVESRYVHSGEVLFQAGDDADSGFVIQEGSFRLDTNTPDKSITVGPGALLGELALMTNTKRPASATALEPSTVLRIPRPLFMKMLEGYPDAAARLRDILAKRIRDSARDIENLISTFDAQEQR